jgi:hypothetical protein
LKGSLKNKIKKQISPLKLCFEKLIFFKMCFQNAGNAISETQIFKISWGGMLPDPLANSCVRYSAHTFGDRIPSWEVGKENGLFGSFTPPLKNP